MKTSVLSRLAFCIFIAAPLQVVAQKEFTFYTIEGIAPRQQHLLAKKGSHFFMSEPGNEPGLNLSVYDTVSHETVSKKYAFPAFSKTIIEKDRSVLFVSLLQNKDTALLQLLELDEKGDSARASQTRMEIWPGPVGFITGSDGKKMLVYQLKRKTQDTLLIRGHLVDDEGNELRNILYSFRFDAEKDANPELFLDATGNLHILVYAKFTSYKLSTDLSVNTISFADEEIESETFFLDKVKLKNMRISRNTQCNCLQAEGIYADGVQKNAKGIYSLQFPEKRTNEISRRFIPFGTEMVKQVKKGFFETEETVKNSFLLQQIVYTDRGSFVILRLNAAIKQQPVMLNGETHSNTKMTREALQNHASQEAGSLLMNPANINNIVINPVPAGAGLNQALPPVKQDIWDNFSPIFLRSHGKNAPRFICVKLGKEDGFDWVQSRVLDIYRPAYNIYNYVNYAVGSEDGLAAIIYQGDKTDQPTPVFVTMHNGSQYVQEIPQKKLWFSSMFSLGNGQYAALYYNYELQNGGLMVVTGEEERIAVKPNR